MTAKITRAALALLLLLVLAVTVPLFTSPAHAADLDCSDFPNQAAAQRNLDANPSDPNNLDSEGDGVACESNPCPCARPGGSNSGGTPSTPVKPKPAPQPRLLRVVNVIDGELVRVRLGGDRPYVIRQIGVDVPSSSCEQNRARRGLRALLKPGTIISALNPTKVRDSDGQGHQYRFIGVRQRGRAYSVGLTQIAVGGADADRSLIYPFKSRYVRVAKKAKADGLGIWGACN